MVLTYVYEIRTQTKYKRCNEIRNEEGRTNIWRIINI